MIHNSLAAPLLMLTVMFYTLASLSPLPALLRRDRQGGLLTPLLALCGLVLHMAAIVVGGIAAERCPVTNRYEIMSLLSWLIVGVYIAAYARYRMLVLSVILTPLALVILVTSNLLEVFLPTYRLEEMIEGRTRSLFILHVLMAILGVAALFLTFASSVTYLLQVRLLKRKSGKGWLKVLPPLDRCDRLTYQSLAVGFPILTLGIVTGSVLNAAMTGHFWQWRVDNGFSVIAWVIFAVLIVARLARGWSGRKAAYLTIAGFVAGVVTMVGMYV